MYPTYLEAVNHEDEAMKTKSQSNNKYSEVTRAGKPEQRVHSLITRRHLSVWALSLSCTPSVSVIILYPECQCHYPVPQCQRHHPVPRVSVSLSCTPSVSVIILYPELSVSLSCTPSVSVIILYPECQCHYPVPQCQCHYPVPRLSVSLSCTPSVSVIILYPSVSVIILYPESQRHYPVPRVSASLSCTPSVSVIILYPESSLSCTPSVSVIILHPECQRHYPVPRVSASLSCTPSVSVIILYPECQRHYPAPRVSASLSCTPSVSVITLYPECQCHYPVPTVSVIILYPESPAAPSIVPPGADRPPPHPPSYATDRRHRAPGTARSCPAAGSAHLGGGDVVGDPLLHQVDIVPVLPQDIGLIDELAGVAAHPGDADQTERRHNFYNVLRFPKVRDPERLQHVGSTKKLNPRRR
ncbi:unnamed protein product [Ranitomeya imitator]|uniref:Uncharacterized protein n=1 Tax=Ranitomeya imitator TaxID=111125 RepID=A0ABN9LGG2_9NEOB|nr:unnamed protein product [Ranitomeya imitator]